jgi:hypothetical protein
MRIAFGSLRTGATAGLAVRPVRNYAQTGWRPRCRPGLIAGAAAVIALGSTYRTAEAQKIFDVKFYRDAEPVISEAAGVLTRERCIFEFRAEELTKRLNDALREQRDGLDALEKSESAGVISRSRASVSRVYAANNVLTLTDLIGKVEKFPRCLNSVGPSPGRSTPQIGSLGGSSATPSDRKLRTTNIRGAGTAGLSIGFNFNGNFHMLRQTETSEATRVVTNEFKDSSKGPGVGFDARYQFPVGNGVQAGLKGSFDYLNQATNHAFASGIFLGNTINSITNVSVTVGVEVTPQVFLFTNFGPSWIDRNQKLNFLSRTTAVDSSAAGVTVGGGVDVRPPDWSVPITVGIDHTFVQQKSVTNPDSPGFTYGNNSSVTTARVGVRVPLHGEYTAGQLRNLFPY